MLLRVVPLDSKIQYSPFVTSHSLYHEMTKVYTRTSQKLFTNFYLTTSDFSWIRNLGCLTEGLKFGGCSANILDFMELTYKLFQNFWGVNLQKAIRNQLTQLRLYMSLNFTHDFIMHTLLPQYTHQTKTNSLKSCFTYIVHFAMLLSAPKYSHSL